MIADLARRGRNAARALRNRLTGPRLAARTGADPAFLRAEVWVHFADGPATIYQLGQWYETLRALDARHPVAIVTSQEDTYRLAARDSGLPVGYAANSRQLESLMGKGAVRIVLYPNHNSPNFRVLRYGALLHVFIGHGESDKASSASNQLKAYDYTFVAGEAGRRRLAPIRFLDVDRRVLAVGRPQYDHLPDVPADDAWVEGWRGDGKTRVLYAPTWGGDRPSMAFGSVVSHGEELLRALLADGGYHVIFRPHPASRDGAGDYAEATARLMRLVRDAGPGHLVDEGEYGWQLKFADALVADISSVAYDWLITGKPMVITRPSSAAVAVDASGLAGAVELLPAEDAPRIVSALAEAAERSRGGNAHSDRLAALREQYFGDTAPGAATDRFIGAVSRLMGEEQAP